MLLQRFRSDYPSASHGNKSNKTKIEAIETANETINSLKKDKSLGFVTTIPCSELAFHMLNRTKNLDKYELIRLHGEDVMVYLISQNRT